MNLLSNLNEAIVRKKIVEEIISENLGEVTDELELVWKNAEIAVRDKVDASAATVEQIKSSIEFMKSRLERIAEAKSNLEQLLIDVKAKLYSLISENGVDRMDGNECRIIRSTSVSRKLDESKVEPELKRYSVEMNFAQYKFLTDTLAALDPEISNKDMFSPVDIKPKCTVTMVPGDHPAITSEIKQSIKITFPKLK